MLSKIRSNDILLIPNTINYTKLKPTAEEPYKETYKNVGYDITIVERCDNRTEDVTGDVNTFATGIVFTPPKHYHLEVMQHPSLWKTGYMFPGGPFILEPDSEEELLIPLYKFKEAEDIELPFRAAILVLRETEYIPVNNIVKKVDRNEMFNQSSGSGNRSYAYGGNEPSRGGSKKPASQPFKKTRGGSNMF
jgi:hypothetical protein